MADRDSDGSGKFYLEQVEEILSLLERLIKLSGGDSNTYLTMCEELGKEPDPERLPPSMDVFPHEVQDAIFIFDQLPDKVDGMAGVYLGKDLACLSVLYGIYEVQEQKIVTFFLMRLISIQTRLTNKRFEEQRKKDERAAKAKHVR